MKRLWFALGLACLVCCLPLILPFLGVASVAGLSAWAQGMNWAEIMCIAAIAGAAAATAFLILRRRRASGPACDVRK